MWRAAREKKKAKYRHVSNDKAGFIEVDEYHLSRTGIRGRKQCLCWTALALLITIALVNLMVSCIYILIHVLVKYMQTANMWYMHAMTSINIGPLLIAVRII